MEPMIALIAVGILAVVLTGILLMVAKFYRKVDQGQALIVNTLKTEPLVTFTGAVVVPIIHRAEVMDISLKTIEIDRRGKEGLICADNIRADIKVTFFVRVNKTREDVLKVAQAIGCARASDRGTLEELFEAKFSEALKTVGKRLNFEDLYKERDSFKDEIIQIIGKDLNGYMLEDAAIDYLEQTPIDLMDRHNILDAQGIRKITELTTAQNVLTNDFRQAERKAITKQNVEADEAILSLQRQKSDAEAKQQREIETMRARELAEIQRVQAEERAKAKSAEIKAAEEIELLEESKQRQVLVAQKNRERVVGIEAERVMRDRDLESIAREREVELQRIQKEKDLENERRQIAEVVRAKISVEKTVVEEEERIKDLRLIAEAKRQKEAVLISAEAEASENLVKELKAAEAAEGVAKFRARERIIQAEADLDAADKSAKAKIRFAEGVQAEAAAEGLAEVRVKEADAVATEKLGMAQARVREATVAAFAQEKAAENEAIRERLLAEAAGEQEKGLAEARVREATAQSLLKEEQARAAAIRDKLFAEADGIAQKAEAMKALDAVSREHEEFRLRLDKDREIELERIRVQREIAQAQSELMSKAFAQAKIQIVGGDGQFFDRFVKAMSLGQSIDGALENGTTLRTLFKDYLEGDKSLPEDLKQVLSRPALGTADAQNLAIAALVTKVMRESGHPLRGQVEAIIEAAKLPGESLVGPRA